MRSQVRRIAISGLVALAAVLGGVAVPATAMAQPASGVRPLSAVTARAAESARAAAAEGAVFGGVPRISCVLTSDCLAIEGTSKLSDEGTAVPTRVARWNGSSWKGLGVALPTGAKSADLNAISCKGAKSCLVVGDYYKGTSSSSPDYPLTLIYNGTSLRPTPAVPLPKGATDISLTSVSCATTTHCVAIAVSEPTGINESGPVTLIETWNGAKWTLHTVTSSAKSQVDPSVVACPTTSMCVLSGELTSLSGQNFSFGVYLGSWNGKTLTRMKAPTVGGSNNLPTPSFLSCASRTNCGVTGVMFGNLSGSTPSFTSFTEVWNGKTWQTAKTTWPKGAQDLLLGLSCYGANSCEGVGAGAASATASSGYAVAVSYKGTTGTVQAVPAPSKGHSNTFADVSCLPWGTCVAAGETGKTTATTPATMTGLWNGKSWKLDPGF
jgi:hypothetical protein